MFKLYYLNGTEKGRYKQLLSKHKTYEECKQDMVEFLCRKGISPYYYKFHLADNCLCVDYGSHYNFFNIIATCKRDVDVLRKIIFQ